MYEYYAFRLLLIKLKVEVQFQMEEHLDVQFQMEEYLALSKFDVYKILPKYLDLRHVFKTHLEDH